MAITSGEQLPGSDRTALVSEAARQEIENLSRRLSNTEARVAELETLAGRLSQRLARLEGRGNV